MNRYRTGVQKHKLKFKLNQEHIRTHKCNFNIKSKRVLNSKVL